ncbi:hypothetical protein L3V83_05495 [Thiotrichales bacterium 19X7-9]|nr:hypothetical protein [Thiotrichales bacterium 19X7-9]
MARIDDIFNEIKKLVDELYQNGTYLDGFFNEEIDKLQKYYDNIHNYGQLQLPNEDIKNQIQIVCNQWKDIINQNNIDAELVSDNLLELLDEFIDESESVRSNLEAYNATAIDESDDTGDISDDEKIDQLLEGMDILNIEDQSICENILTNETIKTFLYHAINTKSFEESSEIRGALTDMLKIASEQSEKGNNMQQIMQISLGDCSTPVIETIFAHSKTLNTERSPVELERDALRHFLDLEKIQKNIGIYDSKEKIEIVHALCNAIFSDNAKVNNGHFNVEATTRQILHSQTENEAFGYNLITKEMAKSFAKLICTNDIEQSGKYTIDESKLKSIMILYEQATSNYSDYGRTILNCKNEISEYANSIWQKNDPSGLIKNTDNPIEWIKYDDHQKNTVIIETLKFLESNGHDKAPEGLNKLCVKMIQDKITEDGVKNWPINIQLDQAGVQEVSLPTDMQQPNSLFYNQNIININTESVNNNLQEPSQNNSG